MAVNFLKRLGAKLYRLWFARRHAPGLMGCGKDAFLHSPFRLEGAQHISVGAGSVMQRGAWLYCGALDGQAGRLAIGDGCVFGYNNHITAVVGVVIEDHVLTANNVYISDNLHSYEDISLPVMHQPVRCKKPVVIGRGSWIGENASIVGASIGKNCVIGANAVVTRDIPDYSVAVGIPAVVIRRFDQQAGAWVSVGRQGQAIS